MIEKPLLKLVLRKGSLAQVESVNPEALDRQFKTAKKILARLRTRKGQILADDAGLGKTWIAAMVGINIILNGGTVLVLVPGKPLKDKWGSDIAKVSSAFGLFDGGTGIPRGKKPAALIVSTYAEFIKSTTRKNKISLLVVDEAHHAKNNASHFKQSLETQKNRFDGCLFLTATPFSINIAELTSIILNPALTRFPSGSI